MVNGLSYDSGCEILLLPEIIMTFGDSRFPIPEGKPGLISQ